MSSFRLRFGRFLATMLPPLLIAGCMGGRDDDQPQDAAAHTPTHATMASSSALAESGQNTPAPIPNQVVIDNFAFQPAKMIVAVGTTVSWVNRDDVPHTATSTDMPKTFDSHTLDTDERFSHRFTKPGTYVYFCALHPQMTGQIVVKEK